jgi:hypothetical protein
MSEFEDEQLKCRDCDADFTFTKGEQEFYKEKGFENKPTRCTECKRIKKNQRNDRSDGGGYGERRDISRGGREERSYGGREERSYSGRDERSYGGREDRSYGGRDRSDREERPKGCFNCGEEGHFSRDCPSQRRERDNTCRQFKQSGECRYGADCRFSHEVGR